MATKSMGTKITGLGRRNHRGSATITYSSATPPEAYPDQMMEPLIRQSQRMNRIAGKSASTVRINSTPERLTSSLWFRGSGG